MRSIFGSRVAGIRKSWLSIAREMVEGDRKVSGYTPLFGEIVTSSIWNEDSNTCKVWVTMMALADLEGNVMASVAGLAPVVRISIEQCEKAIKKLSSPDPYSRTKDEEGRRIKEIDGGWHLVNHKKYRKKAKSRAEYYRNYRETQLQKQKQTLKQGATTCNNLGVAQQVAFYTLKEVQDACIANGIPASNAQSYFDQYNSQDWKKGNGQQITNLQSHMVKRWDKSKQIWDFDSGRGKNQADETTAKQVERMEREGKLLC